MQKIIQKYLEYVKIDENCNPKTEVYTQQMKHQHAARIQQDIEQLEASKRNFLGQDLVSCSLDEVIELGSKLEHALRFVRAKKATLYKEHVEKLKAKFTEVVASSENITQVETDLFIGLPLSQNARDL